MKCVLKTSKIHQRFIHWIFTQINWMQTLNLIKECLLWSQSTISFGIEGQQWRFLRYSILHFVFCFLSDNNCGWNKILREAAENILMGRGPSGVRVRINFRIFRGVHMDFVLLRRGPSNFFYSLGGVWDGSRWISEILIKVGGIMANFF